MSSQPSDQTQSEPIGTGPPASAGDRASVDVPADGPEPDPAVDSAVDPAVGPAAASGVSPGGPGLRERGLVASAWTLGARPLGVALNLARSILVARLLVPEDFGLMLIVNTITMGLNLFSDIGLIPFVNQSGRGDEPAFLQTVWTFGILRGVLLFLLCLGLAHPVAMIYGEPVLAELLPVVGLSTLLIPFRSLGVMLAVRRVSMGRFTVVAHVIDAISLLVIVALAFSLRSVWALAWGAVASTVTAVVLTHLFMPAGIPHRLRLERATIVEIFRFGRWILLSTAMMFFATQVDKLLVGKLLPIAEAGLYGIGLTLMMHAMSTAQSLGSNVLQPVLAETNRDAPEAFQNRLNAALKRVLLFGGGLVVLASSAAAPFFDIFYKDEYAGAAHIAQLLAFPIWLSMVYLSTEQVFLSRGQSASALVSNAVRFVGVATLTLVGYLVAGLPGFIAGSATGVLIAIAVTHVRLRASGISIWRIQLRYALVTGSLLLGTQAVAFALRATPGVSDLAAGIGAAAAGAISVALLFWIERRDDVRWIFSAAAAAIGRARGARLASRAARAGQTGGTR